MDSPLRIISKIGYAELQGRPVYVQSMMHKCIMVKIGGSKKRKLNKNGNIGEIGNV